MKIWASKILAIQYLKIHVQRVCNCIVQNMYMQLFTRLLVLNKCMLLNNYTYYAHYSAYLMISQNRRGAVPNLCKYTHVVCTCPVHM